MSIARPQLDQTIIEKCGKFITQLQGYHSQYDDVNINIKGYLKNGNGVKILLENIEELDHDDIDTWYEISRKCQVESLNHVINMSTGKVELTVEYKRPSKPVINYECLILLIVLMVLTQILCKMNPTRWEILNMNIL